MPTYKAGDRRCPMCGEPLPAHQTWPGARYRVCGKTECTLKVNNHAGGRYVGPNEQRCTADSCSNYVPEGRYGIHPRDLSCSAACWYRHDSKGKILMKCGCGCNQTFLRRSKRKCIHGLVFLSPAHQGNYTRNKHLNESCGIFRDIADEYLGGFASEHYRNVRHVRVLLASFFLFLTAEGITCLTQVTPKTITRFLAWAKNSGRNSPSENISSLSIFFKWTIAEGRREEANPVIGLIHSERKRQRLPRPFEADELDLIWQFLRERGNARLRFAAASAEEAGLRIGEICRLRIEDVDLTQQRFFIRLPNKTQCERWAFFGEKTKRYFAEWMAERDGNCGHEFLLHNIRSHPLKTHTLATEFRRVMCKNHLGRSVNETGFDTWSTHRFRHTMASSLVSAGADVSTVMASGGWKSYAAMAVYARVDPAVARRGYDQAMLRSRQLGQLGSAKRLLTPSDLLARQRPSSAHTFSQETVKRCV